MSVQTADSVPSLPRSYYFVTVSRGTSSRTLALRTGLIHGAIGLVVLMVAWAVGSAVYLVCHDTVLTSFYAREGRMRYAYEERITALRAELDRQSGRSLADKLRLESAVRDLAVRQSQLESRTAVVATLAGRTVALGGPSRDLALGATPRLPAFMTEARNKLPQIPADTGTIDGPAAGETGLPPAGLPAGVLGYGAAGTSRTPTTWPPVVKPHPEADPAAEPLPTGAVPTGAGPAGHAALVSPSMPLPERLALLADSLDGLERRQTGLVAALGREARIKTARWRGVLADLGLEPQRFGAVEPGIGGPFIPVAAAGTSAFDRAVGEWRGSLAAASTLHAAIERIPLGIPLDGNPEVTSPFGTRIDPFLGRLALHTGADLREDYGAGVKATAAGRVTAAGPLGGYGNMVELDHGNGLRSRYAHLEEIDVVDGQMVPAGAIVGRVGATGRATGPHLHYEVRIDGEPVDPMRFLDVGRHLAEADRRGPTE